MHGRGGHRLVTAPSNCSNHCREGDPTRGSRRPGRVRRPFALCGGYREPVSPRRPTGWAPSLAVAQAMIAIDTVGPRPGRHGGGRRPRGVRPSRCSCRTTSPSGARSPNASAYQSRHRRRCACRLRAAGRETAGASWPDGARPHYDISATMWVSSKPMTSLGPDRVSRR